MSGEHDMDTPIDEALLMGGDGMDDENDVADEQEDGEDQGEASGEKADDKTAADEKHEDKNEQREQFIPRTRFDKVYADLKDAERRLAEMEASGTQEAKPQAKAEEKREPTNESGEIDIKALRKQAKEAFLEGDLDKASEIESTIDEEIERRAEERAINRMRADTEKKTVETTVAEIITAYPALDSNSKDADADAIILVRAKRDAYMEKGMSFPVALRKASEDVAKRFGWDKPADEGDAAADDRRQKAVLRGIKTEQSIPPTGGGVGNRAQEPKKDMKGVTQNEWEKMSPADRERALAA